MKCFYVMTFMAVMLSCAGQQKEKEEEKAVVTPVFEQVSIPSMITDPQERASYYVQHYWDKFDFSDTTYIHYPAVTEQAFVDYVNLMNHALPQVVASSIKNMLKKAEVDRLVYTYFTGLYEKYLYDPNSPLRNEEFYISALEAILASPLTDETQRIRPAYLLELALKNRVGEKANNLTYTLADGQKKTLYSLTCEWLVLYFYNPDCEACRELTTLLKESPVIKSLQQKKQLQIVAIYPDEDLTAWKNHLSEMPTDWINGYDQTQTLKNDEVYDLKAIPTLYLLNKEKKVLLKDPVFGHMADYLYSLQTTLSSF
ncbi:DUF5106 domain-containing protein [Parabacteroides sp. PF5-9]|uniref:DUF5106 domain-containing protein n=1 Tax=Parabacteroides sp. PF5-9 TaxID=1742404 RepID=UPI0024747FE0|nr:DUF5106 domain-containing protein [Parabacteroides sp. PF5-9]MDH6358599.1 thiol-disulfide isomerase/thioredoxin [Parabacteroides sp. PF5-9]